MISFLLFRVPIREVRIQSVLERHERRGTREFKYWLAWTGLVKAGLISGKERQWVGSPKQEYRVGHGKMQAEK